MAELQPQPQPTPRPPQQLLFDDGSRIMMMEQQQHASPSSSSAAATVTAEAEASSDNNGASTCTTRRGHDISINEYYEIERLSNEIMDSMTMKRQKQQQQQQSSKSTSPLVSFRVALQFPDELLNDSPEVCWAFEDVIKKKKKNMKSGNNDHKDDDDQQQKQEDEGKNDSYIDDIDNVLIFCLGDTTFASCCPDQVAAAHLEADCLIHYGHACLSNLSTNVSSSSSCCSSGQQQPSQQPPPPVLYSFGKAKIDIHHCVQEVSAQVAQQSSSQTNNNKRLLLLYDVKYQHAIEDIQTQLSERGDILVVTGEIPTATTTTTTTATTANSTTAAATATATAATTTTSSSCCGGRSSSASRVRCSSSSSSADENNSNTVVAETVGGGGGGETTTAAAATVVSDGCAGEDPAQIDEDKKEERSHHPNTNHNNSESSSSPCNFVIGGLELPTNLDWSTFTLLYIGHSKTRQYMNIVLRFISASQHQSTISQYWVYDPSVVCNRNNSLSDSNNSNNNALETQLPRSFQRKLNRRFYLIQKARQCNVFGILVANFSNASKIQHIVNSLRDMIDEYDGRSSYTFVVGKINPAKLANFAEIDCWVLVACPEHSLLLDGDDGDDCEYPKPVLTPLELSMALGITDWGTHQYSLNTQDYLNLAMSSSSNNNNNNNKNGAAGDDDNNNNNNQRDGDDDVDDDAPYFSLLTGRYESAPSRNSNNMLTADCDGEQQQSSSTTTSALAVAGENQLTEYKSAAADFLKQREYQGIQSPTTPSEPVHAAVQGQQGIASNYNNR